MQDLVLRLRVQGFEHSSSAFLDGKVFVHAPFGPRAIIERIVAVADVFDALTTERPYKKAWEVEAAVDFLNDGAGTHFDPACVRAFLNAWEDVDKVRSQYQEEQPINIDL